MTSCTIIVSHYESLPFLEAALRQINKHKNKNIHQSILIADQSSEETYQKIRQKYDWNIDMRLLHMTKSLYSGYGIDVCMREMFVQTDYVCQIHTDAFPISDQWVYLPIKLIEEYNLSFVGQLHFINYDSPTYPPNPFFSMSPTFNVARTETYKEMSLEAGFTRFHNRPQSGLTFKNNDWSTWASEDYNARGSDDDTVAFWWESAYRQTDKVGLAVSGFIESSYGRLIDDIVFHFGSCNESKGVMNLMPELYQEYTNRINEDYSDLLIQEMVNLAKKNKPPSMEILQRNYWDGTLKKHFPTTEEINNRIEELKNLPTNENIKMG